MREQTKRTEIYKRALFLAVPMMIQNGITNMVGLVDNVMVGNWKFHCLSPKKVPLL